MGLMKGDKPILTATKEFFRLDLTSMASYDTYIGQPCFALS